MEKMKGISRIDSEVKKMHGWYVRVYGGGKTFSKYFSDHRYKNKEAAYQAAVEYLRQLTAEIRERYKDYSPRQNQPKYRKRPGNSNSSGVVGVHRCETVSRGKKVCYWVATWNENGKRKDKTFYFGENTRTEEEAKRLAIEWRARKMLELSGKQVIIANGKAAGKSSKTESAELTTWVVGIAIKEWSPDIAIGKNASKLAVKKREVFNEKRIEDLKAFLGLAAEHFDWSDIDYDFGRGVFKGDVRSRCFWNKQGIRTDVLVDEKGRIVIFQGTKPDAYYFAQKKETTEA
jgi:hypothetical protein